MRHSRDVRLIVIFQIFAALLLGGCNRNEQFYSQYRSKRDSFKIGDGSGSDCSFPDCADRRHRSSVRFASAGPPSLNITQTCRAAGSVLQSSSPNCIGDENTAHALLKTQWASFRAADREACVKQSSAYNPSYVEALTCLEMNRNPADHLWAKWESPHTDTDVTGSILKTPARESQSQQP